MRCKTVNYVLTDFDQLCEGMEKSAEELVSLKPVNYYALKDEYIEAAFYSDDAVACHAKRKKLSGKTQKIPFKMTFGYILKGIFLSM